MTVAQLKSILDALPQEAGIFVCDGNALMPITAVFENDKTETDYKQSYILG